MKKFAILAVALLIASSSFAQPRQQLSRGEGFTHFQIDLLTKQLMLNEKQSEAFAKIYTEYSQELVKLRPKAPAQQQGKAPESRIATDEQVEAEILESFDMADKTTALKREYYPQFKTILTPRQILKMYNTERQLHDRITSEARQRLEGRTERDEHQGRDELSDRDDRGGRMGRDGRENRAPENEQPKTSQTNN